MRKVRRVTRWATRTRTGKTAKNYHSVRFSDKKLPSLWKLVKLKLPRTNRSRRKCAGRTVPRRDPSAPRNRSSARKRTKRQLTVRCKYEIGGNPTMRFWFRKRNFIIGNYWLTSARFVRNYCLAWVLLVLGRGGSGSWLVYCYIMYFRDDDNNIIISVSRDDFR